MSRFQKATIYMIILGILNLIVYTAQAAYYVNGKEISKGDAIKLKLKDKNVKVILQYEVVLNEEKMTLVKKKD